MPPPNETAVSGVLPESEIALLAVLPPDGFASGQNITTDGAILSNLIGRKGF